MSRLCDHGHRSLSTGTIRAIHWWFERSNTRVLDKGSWFVHGSVTRFGPNKRSVLLSQALMSTHLKYMAKGTISQKVGLSEDSACLTQHHLVLMIDFP